MCGIFGGSAKLLKKEVKDVLHHRGPDSGSAIQVRDSFLIGAVRLSIVTREIIPTPFEKHGLILAFNGEIFNHKELRKNLESHGVKFQTSSDTEVVLEMYRLYGENCLKYFNGFFSLAIVNASMESNSLFLARDRAGKKPLYIFTNSVQFAFASEIKAFSHLECKSTPKSRAFDFSFDEYVPFERVWQLPPGHFWVGSLNDCPKLEQTTCWWTFPVYDPCYTNIDTAVEDFINLLKHAVELREAREVKQAFYLSGGYDSQLLYSLSSRPETYTVQFKEFAENINEEKIVREILREDTDKINIIRPSEVDLKTHTDSIAWSLEYSVGSFSSFPLYMLSKNLLKKNIRVAFSGEGADELFNGYVRNEMILAEDNLIQNFRSNGYKYLADKYWLPEKIRVLNSFARSDKKDARDETYAEICNRWVDGAPLGYNLSKIEFSLYLQPLLMMGDRMSMTNSVEARNPFLDINIINFSCKLPPDLRYDLFYGAKPIIKQALKIVDPKAYSIISERKIKHGLPAPINKWLFGNDGFDRSQWNSYLTEKSNAFLTHRTE